MRLGFCSLFAGAFLFLAGTGVVRADTTAEAPDYKEVYDLIRENLGGMTEADMNRAAVKGLVSALSPRVTLVTNGALAEADSATPLIVKSNIFDGEIAYVRIGKVADGLADAVRQAWGGLSGSNKLKGMVLDLRYAGGDNYAAAGATANLFLKKEQVLLKWGGGTARSTEKKDPLNIPVAVLVNRGTAGAAEALASVLRQTGIGLILGSKTAGQAMVAKDFPLKNGSTLRIATARVEVAETTTLSPDGVKPDIAVDVSAEDERQYYADAFKVIPNVQVAASTTLSLTNQGNGTNRAIRRMRLNEAELVRERREGTSLDLEVATEKDDPDRPMVHDPALARALDLLKGLAVVRHTGS